MPRLSLLLASTMFSAGLVALPAVAQSEPAETQPPNAPDQQPQSPDQTRAPQPKTMPQIEQTVVAEELPQLWSLEFLPDGRMLVTAKQGDMHIVAEDGTAGPPIEGVPEVDSEGQGGLLDVALALDFETSNRIFFSFSEPREGGNGTSVATENQDAGTSQIVRLTKGGD